VINPNTCPFRSCITEPVEEATIGTIDYNSAKEQRRKSLLQNHQAVHSSNCADIRQVLAIWTEHRCAVCKEHLLVWSPIGN
jgi:hypothetical protein